MCNNLLKGFLTAYFLIVININVECNEKKLYIKILYESLCPDSIRFINQQVYPAWKELAPYVNIKFVPFGKSASYNHGEGFICQHGPKECLGNRIQSCVLNELHDQNDQVEYVNCFMDVFRKSLRDDEELGQSCAGKVGIGWECIVQCYNGPLGTHLQLNAESETATFSPTFVPTILFNNQYDQDLQDKSLTNFRGVVCKLIHHIFSRTCQSPSILQL